MIRIVPRSSSVDAIIIRSGCYGALAGIIIIGTLLCHLMYHYIKLSNNKNMNKTPFVLAFIYFICGILTCILEAFINTNDLLPQLTDEFPPHRCLIGVGLSKIIFIFAVIILYISFLRRIHSIFDGAAFQYKPYVYRSLYIAIPTIPIIFCVIMTIHLGITHPELLLHSYDNGSHTIYYCDYGYETELLLVPVIVSSLGVTYYFVINTILLIMFVKGLWSLNKSMIEIFVNEHVNSPIERQPTTINFIISKFKATNQQMCRDIQSILEVHSLIQKQIILAIIALISSMFLWISIGIYDFLVIHEVVFDFIINSICIWLMFASSQRYWKLCTKYGFCYCCYRKTQLVRKQIKRESGSKDEEVEKPKNDKVVDTPKKKELVPANSNFEEQDQRNEDGDDVQQNADKKVVELVPNVDKKFVSEFEEFWKSMQQMSVSLWNSEQAEEIIIKQKVATDRSQSELVLSTNDKIIDDITLVQFQSSPL